MKEKNVSPAPSPIHLKQGQLQSVVLAEPSPGRDCNSPHVAYSAAALLGQKKLRGWDQKHIEYMTPPQRKSQRSGP